MMMFTKAILICAAVTAIAGPTQATVYDGVNFPDGAISFADAVVSFQAGNPAPTAPHQVPGAALGIPDYVSYVTAHGGDNCGATNDCPYISLGSGGVLTLKFTDNYLTGSGTSADDLYIYEIGPDVESTFVEVSEDGTSYVSLGEISGSTRGVDLDAFGYGTSARFSYIRLTDDPNQGSRDPGDQTVGADIDAVGAISTTPAAVPEPASWALMLTGFGAIGGALRNRREVAVSFG